MNWTNDTCPISLEPAQEELSGIEDVVEFICPTCGRFRITGTALAMILHRDPDTREAALAQAKTKAKEGEIPTIDSSML
ncbi:hypothetical protein LJR235_002901 [Pararhizobium sp. LjRoot235]|uniref:hypothetical protein n=1 Tax=Pararhizobium sp. LjRoot235 TaxID=3342291 RepID=UPI003ECF2D25